jgi:hypothetical protein
MERSRLPTPFRPFQDTRYFALPNRNPIIERQWLFPGFGKKVQMIRDDDILSDDPVDVAAPGRPKGRVDWRIG